jgi:pimeloyl-ACP methyl ester carboxylesterase
MMTVSLKKHNPLTSVTVGVAAAVAVSAVATAFWNAYKARRTERDHPPAGAFLEVDGMRLHYVERGEGPPVVLLHGNAVLLQDFDGSGLLDALAARHRVIAFDRPGFGYSERPHNTTWTAATQAALFLKALAQLDVEQPVVVGHSWGTLVALEMAVQSSHDIRGLVLLSGYYYPTARLDAAMSVPLALPVIGDALRYTISPVTGRLLIKQAVKTMFSPAVTPRSFIDAVPDEMVLRPSQLRAEGQDGALMIPATTRLKRHYGALRLPVEIFAGAADKVVDVDAHSKRLHRDVPHSRLTVVPGAGHMVHYAATKNIAAAVETMSGATGRNITRVSSEAVTV